MPVQAKLDILSCTPLNVDVLGIAPFLRICMCNAHFNAVQVGACRVADPMGQQR